MPRTSIGFPARPSLTKWIVVSLIYVLLREGVDAISHWLGGYSGVSLWHPPVGIDVALIMVCGPWFTPALFLTQFLSLSGATFAPLSGGLVAILSALHAVLYGSVIAFILFRLRVNPRLPTRRDAMIFVVGGAFLLPVVASFFKIALLASGDVPGPATYGSQIFALAVGDATGIATLTPVILLALRATPTVWWDKPEHATPGLRSPRSPAEWLEAVGLVALTMFVVRLAVYAPTTDIDVSYLMALPVVWIALRHGFGGGAIAVFMLDLSVALFVFAGAPGQLLRPDSVSIQLALVTISLFGLVIGALVDEDRRLTATAEEARRRFSGAFRASPNAVLLMTLPDFTMVEVNDAFTKLSGYSSAETLGKTPPDLSLWRSDTDQRRHRAWILEGQPLRDSEVELVSKSGNRIRCQLSTEPFEVSGQKYVVAVARDVTAQRQLERDLLQTAEREQTRLGRELHDHLGQTLTGIAYLSRTIAVQAEGTELASRHNEIHERLTEGIQQLRTLARGMSPYLEDSSDISAALSALAEDVSAQFGVSCKYRGDGSAMPGDEEARTHIYRIVQEAVTNAVRHGGAGKIDITLPALQYDGLYQLSVDDDGCGLPQDGSVLEGMGIRNMRYRAHQLGGSLTLRSTKVGSRVELKFAGPDRQTWAGGV